VTADGLFADRYRIQRLLGRGGMAEVHLAQDTKFDRLVALKLFHQARANADGRQRFLREATVAGRLNHPHIITVYDFGEQDDTVFIAMEYLAGNSLGSLISERQPHSLDEKLRLMIELCEGLSAAHDAGILHRDLKPDNLMVAPGGTLKILDFGIARALDASGEVTFAGSPSYMSPEQLKMSPLDVRSDVFAVGAVFYELLSFAKAFEGANIEQIWRHILNAPPDPLAERCPGLDRRVIAIVDRALEKEPEQRYPDVASMLRELREVRRLLPSGDEATVAPAAAERHTSVIETVALDEPAEQPRSAWTRIQQRLMHGPPIDYAWVALVAIVPVALSWWIGAFADTTLTPASPAYEACLAAGAPQTVLGYGSKLNWSLLFVMISFELFMLRRIAALLFPASADGGDNVAMLRKIPAAGRRAVAAKLHAAGVDGRLLMAVFAVTTLVNVIDIQEILGYYRAGNGVCPRELDWTVRFVAGAPVSRAENALLVAVAYPCQFLAHTLALLVFALFLRHNLFYLGRIYLRHRAGRQPPLQQVVLDFDDTERCFGLRELHSAFNFQILAFISGGALLLTSRIVNVDATPFGLYYEHFLSGLLAGNFAAPPAGLGASFAFSDLFPDFGQVMLGISWLFCFMVVAVPSAVKFLPLIYKHVRLVGRRDYLLEFVPEGTNLPLRTQEEVDRLAEKFSRSSFWPAGDERARVLYTMAYFVFLFLLVPAPPTSATAMAAHAVVVLLLSHVWMKVTFWIFRKILATIDVTLAQA
jgi:predicted Ser/Thr protein kinase